MVLLPILIAVVAILASFFVSYIYINREKKTRKQLTTQDQQAKRRVYELSILKAIQDRIGYSLDTEKVVDAVTSSLKNLFSYSVASGLILKQDKILFKSILEEPVSSKFIDQVKKSMMASLSSLSDKPLPQKVEDILLGVPPDEANEKMLSSFFHIPLVVANQVVGLINVSSTMPGLYKEDEMTILYQITNQASTALSKLEEVISTEEGKLLAMIASLSDGIFMVDQENKLTLINDTAKHMLNIKQANPTIFDVISAMSKQGDFGANIQQALRENKVVEVKELPLDGKLTQITITPVTSTAAKETGSFAVIGAAVTIRDVTIEKQMARLKEDFTSAIVHELRSPLSAIKSSSALFMQEKNKLDEEEQQKILGIINKQSERMLSDINSLLDAAKLESGHFTVMKAPGNINDVLQEAAEFFGPKIQEAGLKLEVSTAPDLPQVGFDRSRMTQVINNLISNSLKFTPSGGKIVLKSEKRTDEINNIQEIVISVADTGIGIPKEKQAGLFNKYTQVQNIGYVHGAEGTGLGLFIIKGIIEAHGGRVKLESVPQHGTTVSFTLPITLETKTEETTPVAPVLIATSTPPVAN